jgi:hypothetical protein
MMSAILLVVLFVSAHAALKSISDSTCSAALQSGLKYNVDHYTAASVGLPGIEVKIVNLHHC